MIASKESTRTEILRLRDAEQPARLRRRRAASRRARPVARDQPRADESTSTANRAERARPRLRLQRPVGRSEQFTGDSSARPPAAPRANGSRGEGTSPNTTAARSSRRTTATSRAATKNSPARPSARTASSISPARNASPLRASAGHPVTQLWYARQGIITPEMEFIAIRENHGRANAEVEVGIRKTRRTRARLATRRPSNPRNSLAHQHPGESLRRSDPERNHPRIRPQRSRRAAAPSSPRTSTTPSSSR